MGADAQKTAIKGQIAQVKPGVAALYAKEYIAAWDGVVQGLKPADYFSSPGRPGSLHPHAVAAEGAAAAGGAQEHHLHQAASARAQQAEGRRQVRRGHGAGLGRGGRRQDHLGLLPAAGGLCR
ncbi:hypothetical protein ACRAWD_16110 [Caulobacter segnis]